MLSAVRLLTASPKSRKNLGQKLLDRGYEEDLVRRILEKLENQGILNDRSYGTALLQSYIHYKVSGKRRISFELKKKGLPPELIEDLVGQYPEATEREKALELARLKWLKDRKLEALKRRKKIYDFLIRRGFDYAIAREALRIAENENRTEKF